MSFARPVQNRVLGWGLYAGIRNLHEKQRPTTFLTAYQSLDAKNKTFGAGSAPADGSEVSDS